MPAGNHGVGQVVTRKVRHIVAKAAVGNVTTDGTRCVHVSGSDTGNGFASQTDTVPGSDATQRTTDKASTAGKAHSGTIADHGIPHIRIGLEGCRCMGHHAGQTTGSWPCDGSAAAFASTKTTRDHPSRHQQLHTHAGTRLSSVQAEGRKVAVKLLGAFEECQRTEQPEKIPPCPLLVAPLLPTNCPAEESNARRNQTFMTKSKSCEPTIQHQLLNT